jgi:hypothetical protein
MAIGIALAVLVVVYALLHARRARQPRPLG